jgi:prolyl-tRNA synthetase
MTTTSNFYNNVNLIQPHHARSIKSLRKNLFMRASQFHVSTLKEAPADADITSQKLMVRAGFIKKLAAGVYNYMPMGLRTIRKVEAIIREEMNAAGAIELLMPVVQPAELWQESGRWQAYGPELLRIKDRHGRDFIVQPTSEEAITDIARQEIKSWRQLPKNFYHIQTKFRDERRPRFGLMRGREFTMKDAYSFDRTPQEAIKSYEAMAAAYRKIFNRFGLTYRAVAADSGAIGGDKSEEFQVIADTGEDAIVYCPTSDYAANIETAQALPLLKERAAPKESLVNTPTPGASTCADVAKLLGIPIERTVKSLVLAADREGQPVQIYLLLVRGDHDMNEVKAGKIAGLKEGFRMASEEEIIDHFGTPPGYLGPINTKKPVLVVAEPTVANMSDFVCGANVAGHHYTGVNWGRDLPEPALVADIRNVVPGDPSPDGKGVLAIERGIEVGHVFYLGTKYSKSMNATFLDENQKPALMEMGCYGIGVTRVLGAAIEQSHDDKGMIWPDAIAPFEAVLCALGYDRIPAVKEAADNLYAQLKAQGVDVILDDRGERPGVMFAEWELIGVPHRITVGERALKEGKVEYQHRRDAASTPVALPDACAHVKAAIRKQHTL